VSTRQVPSNDPNSRIYPTFLQVDEIARNPCGNCLPLCILPEKAYDHQALLPARHTFYHTADLSELSGLSKAPDAGEPGTYLR